MAYYYPSWMAQPVIQPSIQSRREERKRQIRDNIAANRAYRQQRGLDRLQLQGARGDYANSRLEGERAFRDRWTGRGWDSPAGGGGGFSPAEQPAPTAKDRYEDLLYDMWTRQAKELQNTPRFLTRPGRPMTRPEMTAAGIDTSDRENPVTAYTDGGSVENPEYTARLNSLFGFGKGATVQPGRIEVDNNKFAATAAQRDADHEAALYEREYDNTAKALRSSVLTGQLSDEEISARADAAGRRAVEGWRARNAPADERRGSVERPQVNRAELSTSGTLPMRGGEPAAQTSGAGFQQVATDDQGDPVYQDEKGFFKIVNGTRYRIRPTGAI